MNAQQLQQFSSEWQNFFSRLSMEGYTVTYQGGVINIRSDYNRLRVTHVFGKWIIFLDSPWRSPERIDEVYDDGAILSIEYFLNKAWRNPTIYSFWGYQDVAATSEPVQEEQPTVEELVPAAPPPKTADRRPRRKRRSRSKRKLRMLIKGKRG